MELKGMEAGRQVITQNLKYFQEKYAIIIDSEEFYFQKALDVLDLLRNYSREFDGMMRSKKVAKGNLGESKSPYRELGKLWVNRGKGMSKPGEFLKELEKQASPWTDLYILINKFIAYVDKSGWNRQEWNDYEDKRAIARTNTYQSHLINQFLEYAQNGFNVTPEYADTPMQVVLLYLEQSRARFCILEQQHRFRISDFFLGKVLEGDLFHEELGNYFKEYLNVRNALNATCLYVHILYDPLVRKHWDSEFKPAGPVEDPTVERGILGHQYHNPNNHKVADQLGVMDDIQAFASLLAYKQASPPLAIGLFGNWGSGKSYFMTNIEDQIRKLPESEDYCTNIVHVKFNSWHYTDANLWASLVTEIFGTLHSYITEEGQQPDRIHDLYANISISKKKLRKINDRVKELEIKKESLDAHIKIWGEANEENGEVKVKPTKVLEAMLKVPDVKHRVEEVTRLFGITPEDLDDKMDHYVEVYQGYRKRLTNAVKLFVHSGKPFYWFIAMVVAMIIGLQIFHRTVYQELDSIKHWVTTTLMHGVPLSLTALGTLKPYLDKFKKGYNSLMELGKSWNSLKKEQEDKITSEIITYQSEQQQVETELYGLKQELEDIHSGKKLGEFITERAHDDKYKSKLGIISWIREDFEQLNDLLRNQKLAELYRTRMGHEQREFEALKVEEKLSIDRIILYIDDLDRCSEERVVEVLEAVHLLLAFELFGVVVGVDPRWVSHALASQYGRLLRQGDVLGQPLEPEESGFQRATTYDYLEKIFQIPFALLPMEEQASKNLIRSLLKTDKPEKAKQTGAEGEEIYIATGVDPIKVHVKSDGEGNSIKKFEPVPRKIPNQKRAESDPGKLQISVQEIELIQHLAGIIGETPRTIQRFVNVYRIIRAHPGAPLPVDFSIEHKCVIVLLALVVGEPYLAKELIRGLEEEARNNGRRYFKTILAQANPDQRIVRYFSNSGLEDIQIAKAHDFVKWTSLVSRFSFRTAEMVQD